VVVASFEAFDDSANGGFSLLPSFGAGLFEVGDFDSVEDLGEPEDQGIVEHAGEQHGARVKDWPDGFKDDGGINVGGVIGNDEGLVEAAYGLQAGDLDAIAQGEDGVADGIEDTADSMKHMLMVAGKRRRIKPKGSGQCKMTNGRRKAGVAIGWGGA
jgi:hypothetical protein